MKHWGQIAVCFAGGLMLNINRSAHAADAVTSDNPYGPIVVRNVFGLNPLPTNNPAPPDDPPLKITPNGIMSIFGQLQVLFKVAPKAGQPGAKDQSYVLSEGQGQDEIEVTHINEKDGIVTFNNHGTVQDIPLAAAPALNIPMPTAPAGAPPGQNFPTPGGIPPRFGGKVGGGAGGRFGVPSKGNNANPASGPQLNAAPTRAGSQASQGGQPFTAEEGELMTVAAKYKAQQEGDPNLAIFPPTSLDGPAGVPSNLAPTAGQ